MVVATREYWIVNVIINIGIFLFSFFLYIIESITDF
jgi:hypothetical protein